MIAPHSRHVEIPSFPLQKLVPAIDRLLADATPRQMRQIYLTVDEARNRVVASLAKFGLGQINNIEKPWDQFGDE